MTPSRKAEVRKRIITMRDMQHRDYNPVLADIMEKMLNRIERLNYIVLECNDCIGEMEQEIHQLEEF